MRRQQDTSILQAEQAQALPTSTYDAAKLKEHAGVSYSISGNDALIANGRFPNKKISELVKTTEGRDYLGTLWKVANSELQKVIGFQFDNGGV